MLYLILFSAEEFSVFFLGGGDFTARRKDIIIIVQFIIRVLNLFTRSL